MVNSIQHHDATGMARDVSRMVRGSETSDGAGVRLRRYIASPELDMLDPFLLLDAFRSDDPEDYIAGFPPHPHRGFETVTYLLHGRMRHKDSAGHEGVIESGGVQWMTAGRGIEHSEMPEQEQGLLYGFQLWVNLPAELKMSPPRYQEFNAAAIPEEHRDDGVTVRVIAGRTVNGVEGAVRDIAAQATYLDVSVQADRVFEQAVEQTHAAFIFVIEGALEVLGEARKVAVPAESLAVLGGGDRIRLQATADTRLLLIAGQPFREPVARYGPFVMNSEQEIIQAFEDYRNGDFAGYRAAEVPHDA